MQGGVLFFAAQAALALLGAGAAWHPRVRGLSLPARLSVAWGAGAVALTIEATAYSLVGIRWSIANLALPLLVLSAAAALAWRRAPVKPGGPFARGGAIAGSAFAVGAAAVLYLLVCLGSSAATSVDYLLFWGVKAVRFASNRGIDASFLRFPYAIHASLDYPPLVPIVHAWGCLLAGQLPWTAVPPVSALPLVAAIPIVWERLRRRIGEQGAAAVAALWTAAISISAVYSFSGGGAEPMIVFFETVAVVWLLTESDGESRFVPVLFLCGAALTKVEGLAAVVLVALGCWVRDRRRGSRRDAARALGLLLVPLAAVGVWFLYQRSRSLEIGYRAHGDALVVYLDWFGTVVRELLRNLNAGSFWIPWAFAAAIVLWRIRSWRAAAPALTLAIGLLAFLAFDYLHDKDDPTERIGWTAPRVTQSALSAMILAAGVLSLSRSPASDAEAPSP